MLKISLEFDVLLTLEKVQSTMHMSERNDAIDGDRQLSGRLS